MSAAALREVSAQIDKVETRARTKGIGRALRRARQIAKRVQGIDRDRDRGRLIDELL